VQALHGEFKKFVFAAVFQTLGRVEYAPTTLGYFFVGEALDAIDKFRLAPGGKYNVGVRIGKGGYDVAALQIKSVRRLGRGASAHGAEGMDEAIFYFEPGIINSRKAAHGFAFEQLGARGQNAAELAYVL